MKRLRMQINDPGGHFSPKRAARAAIVMPGVFAFADQVIGGPGHTGNVAPPRPPCRYPCEVSAPTCTALAFRRKHIAPALINDKVAALPRCPRDPLRPQSSRADETRETGSRRRVSANC